MVMIMIRSTRCRRRWRRWAQAEARRDPVRDAVRKAEGNLHAQRATTVTVPVTMRKRRAGLADCGKTRQAGHRSCRLTMRSVCQHWLLTTERRSRTQSDAATE